MIQKAIAGHGPLGMFEPFMAPALFIPVLILLALFFIPIGLEVWKTSRRRRSALQIAQRLDAERSHWQARVAAIILAFIGLTCAGSARAQQNPCRPTVTVQCGSVAFPDGPGMPGSQPGRYVFFSGVHTIQGLGTPFQFSLTLNVGVKSAIVPAPVCTGQNNCQSGGSIPVSDAAYTSVVTPTLVNNSGSCWGSHGNIENAMTNTGSVNNSNVAIFSASFHDDASGGTVAFGPGIFNANPFRCGSSQGNVPITDAGGSTETFYAAFEGQFYQLPNNGPVVTLSQNIVGPNADFTITGTAASPCFPNGEISFTNNPPQLDEGSGTLGYPGSPYWQQSAAYGSLVYLYGTSGAIVFTASGNSVDVNNGSLNLTWSITGAPRGCGTSVGSGPTTNPPELQATITTLTESAPNAIPITDSGFGGATCDPTAESCNPLIVYFDLGPASLPNSLQFSSLGNPNSLAITNSIDDTDGSVGLASALSCIGNRFAGTITVSMDDGAQFLFSPNSTPCSLSGTITGSFTSTTTTNDSGTFALTFWGPLNGTYGSSALDGHSDGSSANTPFNIDFTTAQDFTVTASIDGLPAGSLCAEQPSLSNLTTTDPLAMSAGPAPGIAGGVATGEGVFLSLGDGQGNVIAVVGTATDANGVLLPADQMFLTAYGMSGVCEGESAWDAPFTKIQKFAVRPPVRRFQPPPRRNPRSGNRPKIVPKSWQLRLREIEDRKQRQRTEQLNSFRLHAAMRFIW